MGYQNTIHDHPHMIALLARAGIQIESDHVVQVTEDRNNTAFVDTKEPAKNPNTAEVVETITF